MFLGGVLKMFFWEGFEDVFEHVFGGFFDDVLEVIFGRVLKMFLGGF